MEHWYDRPVNDLRWNDLCTKAATGMCALCEALAERDRFIQRWFKGGWLMDGIRAMQRRGVFAFFVSRHKRLLQGLGALLLLALVVQYYWVIPNQQIASVKIAADKAELTTKEFYDLRNSIRQTFAQALGGAALLLGLYLTTRTLGISQETLRTNQEGQITERFGKAIEHLGDKDRLTVRLGGIYALERIARDSPKDHWQIMEVLTAYVRDNAPWLPQSNPVTVVYPPSPSPKPATDIQAVLTVLGRRIRSSDRERGHQLDLAETDLRGASLGGAHLEGANLAGAHLEGAFLQETHLEGAMLFGAHLERANLQNAHLERADLSRANLEGAEYLTGAQLAGVSSLKGISLDSPLWEQLFREQPQLVGMYPSRRKIHGQQPGHVQPS
jgi:hypothetical protein